MPSWFWIAAGAVALIAAGFALSACQRGYSHPAVIATAAVASAFDDDGISDAEERRLNERAHAAYRALTSICDAMEAAFPARAALAERAVQVEELGLVVGHDIMQPRLKACVAFHAEAARHFEQAYRLFFFAAVESAYDREWAAAHGTPPKVMSDSLHYRVLAAILRLRAAGHAADIYHVGAVKVTGYTCDRLRREAPQFADCR